jgi:quinate dehydrogenase
MQCYHPSPETTISRLAEQKGWHVITGEKPMIYQGIEQQKLWLSCGEEDLHVEEVVRIVSEQVKQDKASGSAPPDS